MYWANIDFSDAANNHIDLDIDVLLESMNFFINFAMAFKANFL